MGWPPTTTWPPPSCGTRCTSSSRPCPSTPSTPPSWRPSTTPPSTPRREASAPSTAGKQPNPRHDYRPPLEDPGHPHRTPSTMLLYPVYHNATILCTVYHGQELYPAPCCGNVTSCQTGAVSVQLMHASLLFDTCISADDASLLCIHTSLLVRQCV